MIQISASKVSRSIAEGLEAKRGQRRPFRLHRALLQASELDPSAIGYLSPIEFKRQVGLAEGRYQHNQVQAIVYKTPSERRSRGMDRLRCFRPSIRSGMAKVIQSCALSPRLLRLSSAANRSSCERFSYDGR
jgi:hypothetical protein